MLVDSSGVGSMRWVVGVGAAGSVEGLVACPEGFSLRTLKVPLRTTGSRSACGLCRYHCWLRCHPHGFPACDAPVAAARVVLWISGSSLTSSVNAAWRS